MDRCVVDRSRPIPRLPYFAFVAYSLTGKAPAYLADDCQLTSDVHTRRLRSTDTVMCVVRRYKRPLVHV